MNNIEIFPMTLSDLLDIKPILSSSFDDFWNYNILKSELENANSKYIVAKNGENIIGFAGIIDTVDVMEITNIVVRKDMRNKGVGKLLLKNLIKLSKKNNKNTIYLEVNSNNTTAIKLYENNGFKKVGLRKKYYNNTDDAILMNLEIN